jgi:hypothetical protein
MIQALGACQYEVAESSSPTLQEETVTITDAEGLVVDRYTRPLWRRPEWREGVDCAPWGSRSSRYPSRSWVSQEYVHIGDGKEVPVLTATERPYQFEPRPARLYLCSPDGKIAMGVYSLDWGSDPSRATQPMPTESDLRPASWLREKRRSFFSDLPTRLCRYEEGELREKAVPKATVNRLGVWWPPDLGRAEKIHVVFAPDFKSIKAVLPRAVLSQPVEYGRHHLTEAGSTVVTIGGRDRPVPYVAGRLSQQGKEVTGLTIALSAIPEKLKAAFGQLSE